jgi:hypothetical protein
MVDRTKVYVEIEEQRCLIEQQQREIQRQQRQIQLLGQLTTEMRDELNALRVLAHSGPNATERTRSTGDGHLTADRSSRETIPSRNPS